MSMPPHDWEGAYVGDEPPPWDIGRPQQVFVSLAEQGLLAGRVLDAGCGTGEHTLLAAAHGADALGVDLSETAISRARAKALERALAARFVVGDVLELDLPDGGFDTVIDSGVFHVFDDANRPRYVAALHRLLAVGGRCYLMCFSDLQPGDWGPRRVRRDELESAFADGWRIDELEPARFETIVTDIGHAEAWRVSLTRG